MFSALPPKTAKKRRTWRPKLAVGGSAGSGGGNGVGAHLCHLCGKRGGWQHHVHDMENLIENPAPPSEVPNSPQVSPAPAPPPETLAPPPAAHLVIHGIKSEREIQLEQRLEETERVKKDREMRISELEDQCQQLKRIPGGSPAPKRTRLGPIRILQFEGEED